MSPQTILDFWFQQTDSQNWFRQNDDFDQEIRQRFFNIWQQAAQAELWHWRKTLQGRLAEIIILDQFSRNLFRHSPQAFAQDSLAIALCQEMIAQPQFADLPEIQRHFALMPLMHSESRLIHQWAESLFRQYTSEYALDFELKHKVIIDRFGRYPHRNAVLNRESTAEELAFLQQPNSSF